MEKTRDVNSKVIFHDPILCSQFLHDNIDIPIIKDVRPEDIEDVSASFQSFLGTEFEADTVKKIHIRSTEEPTSFYLISLIEHKSRVDYDVSMQLLKYMVMIWVEYAKEMKSRNAGNNKSKAFRYPPILPIVYYEGAEQWSAGLHLQDRVFMNEIFGEYIPDFSYRLIRIHDYSNEELLKREDEMSLLMMINKVQTPEDFQNFLKSESDKINEILAKTPERILQIIADTIWGLCKKMNVPEQETRQCVEKVRGRQMGYLFENMEKMDIQAERRNTQIEREKAQAEREKAQAEREKAQDALKQLKEAKQKIQDIEYKAKDVEQKAYHNIVKICAKHGGTKEEAVQLFMDEYDMSKEKALETVNLYWNK